MINLQTQFFGDNICQWSQKIIHKLLPNLKLSKTVGPGFMKRQVLHFWTPHIKGLSKHDRSLSCLRPNSHHVYGLEGKWKERFEFFTHLAHFSYKINFATYHQFKHMFTFKKFKQVAYTNTISLFSVS